MVHGFVEEDAQTFGEAVAVMLGEELLDVVEDFGGVVFGHGMCSVGCVWRHLQKETDAARPRPVFHEGEKASPQRSEAGGEEDNLQKRIYTDEIQARFDEGEMRTWSGYGHTPSLSPTLFNAMDTVSGIIVTLKARMGAP
jgi:hypothetical protein